jgi:hypothetical protein
MQQPHSPAVDEIDGGIEAEGMGGRCHCVSMLTR